jgi:hypothetical protein
MCHFIMQKHHVYHDHSKHVHTCCHLSDCVEEGNIVVDYVKTGDLLTKPLLKIITLKHDLKIHSEIRCKFQTTKARTPQIVAQS